MLKKLSNFTYSVFFPFTTFITNLHFNRRCYLAETTKMDKQTQVMQQLKVKDSVAVREPLTGSEVSLGCFLLQASRYLFIFCWACFSKVSKSSASNLPFAGNGSYSVFESKEGKETQN